MIPIHQTKFGIPDGDCFSACVASILEVPLDAVPHIPTQGYSALQAYLAPMGLQYLEITIAQLTAEVPEPARNGIILWPQDTYLILCGPSPNVVGVDHAVVGRIRSTYTSAPDPNDPHGFERELHELVGWEVAHDPNPRGTLFHPDAVTAIGFFIRTGDPRE